MAHYAFIDENNKVVEVIAGVDENELIEGLTPEQWYSNFKGLRCIRTSYNGNIRKNFAGIGAIYNEEHDAFIGEQPYDSWILNPETLNWEAPIEYPSDGNSYYWDEELGDWIQVQ